MLTASITRLKIYGFNWLHWTNRRIYRVQNKLLLESIFGISPKIIIIAKEMKQKSFGFTFFTKTNEFKFRIVTNIELTCDVNVTSFLDVVYDLKKQF